MIIDSPIISGSYAATGSLNQVGNVVITGSLTVTEQITGSINSASFSQFAISSSYAATATSASNALTASYLSTYIPPFPYTGSAGISGSLTVNGDITSTGTLTAQQLNVQIITSSVEFVTGSTQFGSLLANTHIFTGSVSITGSLAVNNSPVILTDQTSSMSVLSASYAANSTSASYSNTSTSASYANSASYAATAISASYANSASYAQTASYATNIIISGSIANVDYIDFDLTASFAAAAGRLGYDSGEGTLQFGLAGGNVTLNIGEDLYQYVYNAETSSMTKGQVVYVSGSQGNRIAVRLADNSADRASASTLGFVAETITAGGTGWVMTEGNLRKLDTTGLIGGKLLFLGSTPGTYTQTPPVAPAHGVRLGYAERIDNIVGSIYVKIDNGYELGELHDVLDTTTTSSYGDLFVKSGSLWINSKQLTGSYGVTGSINATSFTGSLLGTASFATSASYANSSSYAAIAISASYSNTSTSASYAASATSASYSENTTSASYALTSSFSLSGTGFPFSGSAVITGSLLVTNLGGSNVKYLVTDNNGNITAQDATASIKQIQTFTASAGQTTFNITNGYTTGLVDVFVNGTKLNPSEFTDTSGTSIVLLTGSFANDIVEFNKYLPAAGVTNNSLRQQTTFTATGGQTVFSASYTPGLIDIFYNGSRLTTTEYTANNGTFFTLATASAANDILDVFVYSYQVGAFSGIGGGGAATQIAYFDTTNSITGSPNFTISGSTMTVTGSLTVSGSGTFTNIGPAIFSGSLTSTQGFTGSFSGTATNSSLLNGSGSGEFVPTGSFNTFSSSILTYTGSANSRFSSIETVTGSNISRLSSIEAKTGSYATTGSNTFVGNQVITGSLLQSGSLSVNGCIVSTGQIVAQTINVQQVTSSIVYSCGSNIFGTAISNTQTFTGSMYVTGSNALFNVGCVGIGVSIPYSNLHVAGTIKVSTGNAQGILGLGEGNGTTVNVGLWRGAVNNPTSDGNYLNLGGYDGIVFAASNAAIGSQCERFRISSNGTACFACDLTAKTIGTNDLILNNLNYECANYVDGTRGSWLIQEGACDLFIINQISCKKYKFNLIEIK